VPKFRRGFSLEFLSDVCCLIAIVLKFMPEETLSSFSYSPQLFRSTHDAIIDDRSADENDDRSAEQKDAL
jgi:hypothetical protein